MTKQSPDDLAVRDPSLPGLADRQPLGILPTREFWLRKDVQRKAWPLFVVGSLPLFPLTMLAFWAGANSWVWMGATVVYAVLMQGVLERHIRKKLRQRAAGVLPESR